MCIVLSGLVLFSSLTVVSHGWTYRWYIVNGPDYVQVGQHMFNSYVKDKACTKVVVKRYRRERAVVSMCEV